MRSVVGSLQIPVEALGKLPKQKASQKPWQLLFPSTIREYKRDCNMVVRSLKMECNFPTFTSAAIWPIWRPDFRNMALVKGVWPLKNWFGLRRKFG